MESPRMLTPFSFFHSSESAVSLVFLVAGVCTKGFHCHHLVLLVAVARTQAQPCHHVSFFKQLLLVIKPCVATTRCRWLPDPMCIAPILILWHPLSCRNLLASFCKPLGLLISLPCDTFWPHEKRQNWSWRCIGAMPGSCWRQTLFCNQGWPAASTTRFSKSNFMETCWLVYNDVKGPWKLVSTHAADLKLKGNCSLAQSAYDATWKEAQLPTSNQTHGQVKIQLHNSIFTYISLLFEANIKWYWQHYQ